MSGYLNNFVGYFLNFFKKENRNRMNSSQPMLTACSTPPRRCKSVIENRCLKEDIFKCHAKQKGAWTSSALKVDLSTACCSHNGCCCKKFLQGPEKCGNCLNSNETVVKQINERGDGLSSPEEWCIYTDAAISKDFPSILPPYRRRQQSQEHPSFGLRRSFSLESCYPTEDKKRLSNCKVLQMHHNLSPLGNATGMCLSLDSDKDFTPFKRLDLSPSKQSGSSRGSPNMLIDAHRPKQSKIPTFRKDNRPAKISKSLSKQFESAATKRPDCNCHRGLKSWRAESHTRYCPRTVVAYRSHLNNKLENLFRLISKKKYCGNIIDASSHSRWMKLAESGVDEDAAYFKKIAKGRVVLPVSVYKGALMSMCSDEGLDYWDLLQKMTDVELEPAGSNTSINR